MLKDVKYSLLNIDEDDSIILTDYEKNLFIKYNGTVISYRGLYIIEIKNMLPCIRVHIFHNRKFKYYFSYSRFCEEENKMLTDIKKRAIKATNPIEKSILRVLISEIEMDAFKNNRVINAELVQRHAKTIIKSNNLVLTHSANEKLRIENKILEEFLPKPLTFEDFEVKLGDKFDWAGNPNKLFGLCKSALKNDYFNEELLKKWISSKRGLTFE